MANNTASAFLDIHPAVSKALNEGRPLLALESEALSHGLPFPRNLELFTELCADTESLGVQPAITAIIAGRLKVGLSPGEVEYMAQQGKTISKASRRDLTALLASGQSGSTTVATTMMISAMAGIKLMATGGIGGVHRGAEASFDISADLHELANTRVAVVCSGPKAILDLGLTREYLETLRVPVIGYGTEYLPAFYTPSSQETVDHVVSSPEQAARLIQTHEALRLRSGLLICNPVPDPFAVPLNEAEEAIQQALEAAHAEHIRGKALTPFLLARINQCHGEKLLQANTALIKNNVRLAAAIAVAMASKATD